MWLYSDATSAKLVKVLTATGQLPADTTNQSTTVRLSDADLLEERLSSGSIKEETLCSLLAKGYSMRRINLRIDQIDPKALNIFNPEFLGQQKAVPFAIDNQIVKIGVVDPASISAPFKENSGLTPEFYLLNPSNFEQIISHSPTSSKHSSTNTLKTTPSVQSNSIPSQTQYKPSVVHRKNFRTKWPIYEVDLVVEFCDQLLRQSIEDKCSDIHIECFRDCARVRMRNDGTLHIMEMYSEYLFKNYQSISTRFKILAGCDISEKRLAQDGAITIQDNKGKDVDFRFSLVPTKNGERIVIRILAGDPALSLDKIGFTPTDYQKVVQAITSPQGMVLVTGPTGSGKTTTLYGALQYINTPDINILTVEDPVEYYLEGAGQVQANDKIGLTFASILRSFLRQDPEVILVGEIRDQETIDIAIKASLTGHLLLSTLHTNDAISSISRMINMGVPNFLIASAVSLIIGQRLARQNCLSCRTVDTRVTSEVLLHIGFGSEEIPGIRPMRGIGCPTCNGSGYKGRKAIYEVLKKTKYLEEAILNNEQAPGLLEAARKDGFRTMQEIAREMIALGDISVEEFQRTLVIE
jgi:type IV pilus assembly protein PilB